MDRAAIIDRLRAHEGELKAAGVLGVSLFGAAARGGAAEGSDVDLAVRLGPDFARGGFHPGFPGWTGHRLTFNPDSASRAIQIAVSGRSDCGVRDG